MRSSVPRSSQLVQLVQFTLAQLQICCYCAAWEEGRMLKPRKALLPCKGSLLPACLLLGLGVHMLIRVFILL